MGTSETLGNGHDLNDASNGTANHPHLTGAKGESNGVNGSKGNGNNTGSDGFPIAICGMALRLPGGIHAPQDLWSFLIGKGDARSPVPKSRYNIEAYHSMSGKPGMIKAQHGYFLDAEDDLGHLDSSCFSIPRGELERMDPHQRQMLEVVRECLDDAGEVEWRGSNTGCYMGSFGEDWCEMFAKDPQQYGVYRVGGYGDFMLSNRVSYELDLQGPSMTLRTGCSAALVGLHEACVALERGDCTAAIVGGANLILAPGMTAAMTEQGVLSPDGSCKTFSADANGYARGEAINAVFVKPLSAALRDGNPIRGVIRSTASNNDGKTPGISYPSTDAQEALIRRAYAVAGIDEAGIAETGFVECHGTGTAIGDPVETNAIARVFGDAGVHIGSVKPNVGHSEGASGITSLIKAVLALEHQTIPPNIKFGEPNPKIPFEQSKLVVPVEPTSWPQDRRERASINSFGIGGSNVHVVVDSFHEYNRQLSGGTCSSSGHHQSYGHSNGVAARDGVPAPALQQQQKQPHHLLLYSANSTQSLGRSISSLQEYAAKNPNHLAELAYTLATRREKMQYRSFQVVNSTSSEALQIEIPLPTSKTTTTTAPAPIVMVFTGQGAQWPRMGSELLHSNAAFRRSIVALDSALQRAFAQHGIEAAWSIERELEKAGALSQLGRAEFAQPLCTAVQIGLVDALAALDIKASAVVGHSSGEIAAAYSAGALTAEQAIVTAWRRGWVVSQRQQQQQQAKKGAMAAIGMSWAEVKQFLVPHVVVACDNSPKSVTLSGNAAELKSVVSKIQETCPDVLARLLKVDQAYHSHHMVEIGESYRQSISAELDGKTSAPTKPFFSSVSGSRWHASEGHLESAYWQRNLESPVLFQRAVLSILDDDCGQNNPVFLEIGPHPALAGPIRQILASASAKAQYVSTMTRNQDCTESLLTAVGKLFSLGVLVNCEALTPTPFAVTLPDLPRYPWNHQESYWYESRISKEWRQREHAHHDLLGVRQAESSDLEPSWRNVLHIQNAEWLRDHRIEDKIVFPCAGYLAMAGEAVRQLTAVEEAFSLRHVTISAALVLTEGQPIEFITSLRPMRLMDSLNSQWWEFSIVSHNSHGVWAKHCSGEVTAQPDEAGHQQCQPVASLERTLDKARYYDFMRKAGNHYGPAFQVMHDIRAGTRRNLATARVANNRQGDKAAYHLHPTIVDAALQLFSMGALNGYTHVNKYSKVVPTKIAAVTIRRFHNDGEIDLEVAATIDSRGDLRGSGRCLNASQRQILSLEGAVLSAIDERSEGDAGSGTQVPPTARYTWGPHIDLLDTGRLIRPSIDLVLYTPTLDRLHALCVAYSKRLFAGSSNTVSSKQPHLHRFRSWIEQQDFAAAKLDTISLDDTALLHQIDQLVDKLSDTPAADSAIAMRKVATNLDGIMSGSRDALEILLADETLNRLYTFTDHCDRTAFLQALAHSKPNLRILEIGAGTGASTAHILEDLFLKQDSPGMDRLPLYSQYTFTDISPGFFLAAKERFKGVPNMEYKALDISKNPADQGFQEDTKYDLVIATNVLHATPSLSDTLKNVLGLLDPEGRLLLHELCPSSKWVNFVFGPLPGWWCGAADDDRAEEPYVSPARWNEELRAAGFRGLDAAVLDSEEPFHLNAIMVARPQAGAEQGKTAAANVTVLAFPEQSALVTDMSTRLHKRGYRVAVRHPGETLPAGQHVLCLLDCHRPYLEKMGPGDLAAFQQLVGDLVGDAGMLWVTGLSQVQCRDPRWAQTVGAARTIRSELATPLATCEVDDLSLRSATADRVIDVFHRFRAAVALQRGAARAGALDPDFEYAIVDGRVQVGRFYPFSCPGELLVPENPGEKLTLQIKKPGRLSSLEWRRCPLPHELQGDEVEVEAAAAGLNFRDVLSGLGIVDLPEEGFGLEASGVVSRVGPDAREIKVGDRVVLFGRGAFSTHVTASEQLCEKIPDELSFVDGATIPCVYATAVYSLFNVGRLQKDETILIHSACGGVGLAAIQLAKMVGADIYVTVGTEDKIQHLMKTLDLPRNRIFNSRNTSFLDDIMRATNGRGVDLALNSLSGELLHATWRCIAEFGRMIEIGKRDLIGAAKLDMDVFLANRSYCCVDLDQICQKKPAVCKSLLRDVVNFYRQGHILPIGPATVFAAPKALDAFRYMQQGLHMGKIVIAIRGAQGDLTGLQSSAAKRSRVLELDGTASYLLIGGLGGLGRATSRYMVEHGARRLVFLSRSAGVSAEDQAFARELRSMGCEVELVRGDVTDEADVAGVVRRAPNLRGVVQMSMVLRDQAFGQMTMDEWDGAVQAKVQGTWNLHKTTANGPALDFFLLFSSLSGVIGQPGQVNYAGANTFLDAFVQYRNAMGLSASSIQIGAVEDAGYIANSEHLLRKMKTSSAYAIREEELLDAVAAAMMMSREPPSEERLGSSLSYQAHNTFVLGLGSIEPLGSPDCRAIWRSDRRMAVYHNLAAGGASAAGGGGSGSNSLQAFLACARADPAAHLQGPEGARVLAFEIGKRLFDFLLRPQEDLAASTGLSLAALGMDSLVAIEMRTWWRQTFGFDISVLEMLGMGTLEALGKHAAEGLLRTATNKDD